MRKHRRYKRSVIRSIAASVLAVLASSCSSGSPAVECVEPPEASLDVDSDFELLVEPNPVGAGAGATLTVDDEEPTGSYIGSVGALWECWDGDEWVNTHLLVRADGGQAKTFDLSTEPEIDVPDVGLNVPNTHQIIIPEVQPGVYRITDIVYNEDSQTELMAHEFVVIIED